MAKLGSFAVVKKTVAAAQVDPAAEPKYDTFEFEGADYRVINETPSGLPLMEFADAMQAEDDDGINMEAIGAIYQMLQSCILPQDWAGFRKAAIRSGASTEELLSISQAVWGAVVSRPTRGPSDSPDGPSTTGTTSKESSPEPTDRRSSFTVDLPDQSPSVPVLRLADGWTPPATMPGAGPLVSVDDLAAGRATA